MALSDDVVLNLVLKMKVDPAEAQRIATQGLGPVEAELRASLERQKDAYANAAKAIGDQAKAAASDEIKAAQSKTAQLAAAARVLSAEQSAAAKQLATEQSAASKSALMAQTLAARESAAAAKQSAAEQIAASRLAAAAQIAASRDAAAAAKVAEKAERDKVASARATDAETQRMGRMMSQAYAENAARDAAAAKSKDDEIQRMGRAQSAAMVENAAREKAALREVEEAHHRHIESIRAVTETAFIWFEMIKGGIEKFKQFGEEVVRTSNIYAGFKGSIKEAQEATEGGVAAIDLMVAHNHMTELGLKLTGEQFALVSEKATTMAHRFGTDVPTALNKLIDGLALGKIKALDMAGVIVHADAAHAAWAKTLGVAVDQLDDEAKHTAIAVEAMKQIEEQSKQNATAMHGPVTVAQELERIFTHMKDTWNEMMAAIGNFKIPEWLLHPKRTAQDESDMEDGNTVTDPMTGQVIYSASKQERGARQAELSRRAKADADQAIDEKWKNPSTSYDVEEGLGDRKKTSKAAKVSKSAADSYDFIADLNRAIEARDERELLEIINGTKGPVGSGDKRDPFSATGTEGLAQASVNRGLASTFGGERFTPGEEVGLARGASTGAQERDEAQAREDKIKSERALLGRKTVDETVTMLDGSMQKIGSKQSGPGLIERLMFGETGAPDMLREKMTEAQKITFDATKKMEEMINGAGNAMAGAMGHAFASAIGESKNLGEALKQGTHAVLMSLSEQALVEGLMQTAKGVAALASVYDAWQAPGYFTAAAAFGAVGVAAGIGARLTNSAPSGGGGGGGGGGVATSSRGSSSGGGGSSGGSEPTAPVNIYLNVLPGGEAQAGASILSALEALKAQTGVDLIARMKA